MRLALALLVCLVAFGSATPASALTPGQAKRDALHALRPQGEKAPYVVVFGLGHALGPREQVQELPDNGALSRTTLGRRTWLFWEDLAYGAKFTHPSRLVLIDDATGKVVKRASMQWWPLIDGRDAPFIRARGAADRRYRVYTKFRQKAPQPAATAAWTAPLGRASANATLLKGDCVLMAGDIGGFGLDFKAVNDYFKSRGATVEQLTNPDRTTHADGKDLAAKLNEMAPNCPDIVLYLNGHGKPSGAISTGEFNVEGKNGRVSAAERKISVTDIRKAIAAHPQVKFKLIVDSCYSGNQVAVNTAFGKIPPNVAIIVTSSNPDEYSWGWGKSIYTSAFVSAAQELDSFAENFGPDDRMVELIKAAAGADNDAAALLHLTHPKRFQQTVTLTQPTTPTTPTQPQSACSSAGATCPADGASCSGGATCTGNSAICSGSGTTCGPGSGDSCSAEATCSGPGATCTGSGTQCTQQGDTCTGGATCPSTTPAGCSGNGTTGSQGLIGEPPGQTYGYTNFATVIPASCKTPSGTPVYSADLINDADSAVIACHDGSIGPVPGQPACPGGNYGAFLNGYQLNPPAVRMLNSSDATWTLTIAAWNGPQGGTVIPGAHLVYAWKGS